MPGASHKPVYPAIVACMNETRLPGPAEIEVVAARVWAETHDMRAPRWEGLAPASAARWTALCVALAALGVRGEAITRIAHEAGKTRRA